MVTSKKNRVFATRIRDLAAIVSITPEMTERTFHDIANRQDFLSVMNDVHVEMSPHTNT